MSSERVIKNEDGTVTVTLRQPISAVIGAGDPMTVAQITLKRPKAKDLRRAKGKGAENTLSLLTALTGIAPPYLDELDGADFLSLSEALTDFLEISPKAEE